MYIVSVAPTAVRDLEAVPSSLTSIYLIWKHPEYPNSQLTQYIIYYRANPSVIQMFPGISSDDFNVSLPLSFPMTRYYLTGLSVFTNYSIHLSVMGNSVPNAPIEHEILERTNTSGKIFRHHNFKMQSMMTIIIESFSALKDFGMHFGT